MVYRPRLTQDEYNIIRQYRSRTSCVLVIGDLHLPFIKAGYLEFCIYIYKKYNCTDVIFIGDILDNHASSFWESDPDGHSAGEELSIAHQKVQIWNDAFPEAKVCVGNHDAIPGRKIFASGVSKQWLKTPNEVLDVSWEFKERFRIDGVQYTHGLGQKARARAKNEMHSIVQGHYHSESYIEWYTGPDRKIFAMQIGCGIDRRAYSMAYGRNFKKPHINVGIVVQSEVYGTIPIIEYMKLS